MFRRSLFTTATPGSGIFLPVNRATRKTSPTISTEGSFPPTPTTPSLSTFNIGGRANLGANGFTPPTPSMPKFSQSVGPGRSASPALNVLKPKSRPSLPRPESPLRKAQNSGATTTPGGRPSLAATSLAKNGLGGSRYGASPSLGKFGASVRGTSTEPSKKLAFIPKTPTLARPASRNQTNLGPEPLFDDEDTTPVGVARSSTTTALQGVRSEGAQENKIQELRVKLEERDKQLKEQATSLAEMEKSLLELQSLLPDGGPKRRSKDKEVEDADVTQLRALLREKNEKISMLTAEFDAHRADFRSTIDTLEMASTETERVYEKRVDDLLQELRELQDRGEDVESVARQLKQLEELVQELEEGLEDARRGEAEARGEVEFLRGEVERGRSELKREREKAAAALKDAGPAVEKSNTRASKDLEQRDDEIRGLKAIIHSLSRDSMISDIGTPITDSRRSSKQQNGGTNGLDAQALDADRLAREKLERQVKELEGLIERKAYREEELEREIERMKTGQALEKHQSVNSLGSHRLSDRTVLAGDWRDAVNQSDIPPVPQLEPMHESDSRSSVTDGSALWCEICETGGHDILTCTNMFGAQNSQSTVNGTGRGTPNSQRSQQSQRSQRTGRDAVYEGLKGLTPSPRHSDDRIRPLSPKKNHSPGPTPKVAQGVFSDPLQTGMVAGKASGVIDETKWCALCERDGHESVDCPFEDAF
jgi:hypothetical protein